jgi:hypothetical protein
MWKAVCIYERVNAFLEEVATHIAERHPATPPSG